MSRYPIALFFTDGSLLFTLFQRSGPVEDRSEEHTSELQSRRDLVCRLLLEKKKKKNRDVSETHHITSCTEARRSLASDDPVRDPTRDLRSRSATGSYPIRSGHSGCS